MSTENEEWREDSKSENTDAGRDGNRSFNREGGYSRPSYNREGGDRPYRPRYNNDNRSQGSHVRYVVRGITIRMLNTVRKNRLNTKNNLLIRMNRSV